MSVALVLSLSSCSLIMAITVQDRAEKREYYSDTENFGIYTGELVGYTLNSDDEQVVLHVKGWDVEYPEYVDSFMIEGESYKTIDIAIRMGELKQGDNITFVSATRIFGNGYMPPMVALRVGERSLLDLEQGYKSFMEANRFN